MSLSRRTGEKKRRAAGTRWRVALECVMALLALAQVQMARAVSVEARLERTQMLLGDSLGMEIIVSEPTGGTISVEVPRVDGLEIRYSGSGVQFVNMRRSDIRSYVVTALRDGRFVIPAIPVQVNGQTLRTNELVVVVQRTSQTTGSMRLTASVSKKECYVLEPVNVTFKWYISSDVQRYDLNIPLLAEKDDLSLNLLPPAGPTDEIVASRYQLRAGVSSERLDGTEYSVRSLTFRIFPPRSGSYTVGRAAATAFVQTGYRIERDIFGSRRVPDYQRAFAASEPVEIVVKELPADGRPPEFAGAVGKFDVSVQTDDTQVKVGDPILLKIIVSGDGLLQKIKRPLLSQDAAFSNDFLINESLAPGEVSGGRVTFEQTIRARSAEVKEIPVVRFAYFNPQRGAYEFARSKPIPIRVIPTTEVTAEDVVKFGTPAASVATTRLEEQPGGILANYNHLDALRQQAIRWSVLPFLSVPPAAYFVVLALVSRRRKLAGNAALARAKSAKRLLKKHLAEARSHLRGEDRRFYDSVARGIGRFTSDRLNLGTGELTAYDVDLLADQNKISKELSLKISQLLDECDAGRFSASAQSPGNRRELLRRAEELIRTLEKTL